MSHTNSLYQHAVLAEVAALGRHDVAGIGFDFVLMHEVMSYIERWRRRGQRQYVVLANPNDLMLSRRDPHTREATARGGLILPDGVGVVLAAKLLGYGRRHRVTGPALMLDLCDQGRALGYRHYFFGGAAGVPEKLVCNLKQQFPGLIVAGAYSPPFRPMADAEKRQIIERINQTKPDVVWVGLGAPKQQKWMLEHVGKIEATALIGVGAAFDFHSGNVSWAPHFVRRCGIEWAYRLATNPRRMWRRNLDLPLFLMHVLAQAALDRLSGRTRQTSPERRHAAGIALAAELASRLPAGMEFEDRRADREPVGKAELEAPLVPV
jgi:N-acetylglucosaminyldiphosphoundecaprenol N-acetyl-beta-D-mannosaminyltransferase